MGCGVSRFDPPEGTAAAAEGQPTSNDADSPPTSADAVKSNANSVAVAPSSGRRLRGLRRIRRYQHHHQVVDVDDDDRSINDVSNKNPATGKDGEPLVVVVNAGGEKSTSFNAGSNRSGHREDSIFVSVSSPSFRVYCLNDVVLPPLDDHDSPSHDHDLDEYLGADRNGEEGEKENKAPTSDVSNKMKGEEGGNCIKKKKKGGGGMVMRGRGTRSVLQSSRGGGGGISASAGGGRGGGISASTGGGGRGGGGGMRHILNYPHRLRNRSSKQLY